jgi:hypothetical protein
MPTIEWSIQGPHFVNCNCDYGCPCQFNARPTDGTCRAVVAWRIDEGHFGNVRLDGLLAVNTYGWPGPIHEGNGSMQSVIDERGRQISSRTIGVRAIHDHDWASPGRRSPSAAGASSRSRRAPQRLVQRAALLDP